MQPLISFKDVAFLTVGLGVNTLFFQNQKGPSNSINLIYSKDKPVEIFEKYQKLDPRDLFKVSRCGPVGVPILKCGLYRGICHISPTVGHQKLVDPSF